MASPRQRNDRRGGPKWTPKAASATPGDWLWGWHPVVAALQNPSREPPRRLLATAERAKALKAEFGALPALRETDAAAIGQALPQGAVHQGVAADIPPLEPLPLETLGSPASGVLLMLDQVTDPQNIGAILRSAAALGARGLILQDRHAPIFTGALAKAAAGAADRIPTSRVVNLSRALETLADLGWRAVGLDGSASKDLAQALDGSPTVLVLGSEGDGLRRLVAEHCDELARIPMPGGFESLNVSAAAAIALYEALRPSK